MPSHAQKYRSGVTQCFWWAVYWVCQPFIHLGRRARRCARWVAELWGDLMLAPAKTSSRLAMGVRWLVLIYAFALAAWAVVTVVTAL